MGMPAVAPSTLSSISRLRSSGTAPATRVGARIIKPIVAVATHTATPTMAVTE